MRRREMTGQQLADRFTKLAGVNASLVRVAAEAVAKNTEEHVKRVFGDLDKLVELAQSTQDERVALGYSPDEPLLRSGELRASVTSRVEELPRGAIAGVGTEDPKMFWLETGTKRGIPPRPAFEIGSVEAEKSNIAILRAVTESMLTGEPPAISVARTNDDVA